MCKKGALKTLAKQKSRYTKVPSKVGRLPQASVFIAIFSKDRLTFKSIWLVKSRNYDAIVPIKDQKNDLNLSKYVVRNSESVAKNRLFRVFP